MVVVAAHGRIQLCLGALYGLQLLLAVGTAEAERALRLSAAVLGLLLCSSQHMPRAACACMGIGQGSGRTARWFQSGHLRTIASMIMGDVDVRVGGVGSTLGIMDGDRPEYPI